MPTPFPGMDPYLERRGLWEEVHISLIVAIRHFLTPLLRPRYRAAIEPSILPQPEEIVERYLGIRDTQTHEVITAIEILSPTNTSTASSMTSTIKAVTTWPLSTPTLSNRHSR